MGKKESWDADERWDLALKEADGRIVEIMKESIGIVADDGSVELQ